MRIKRTTREGLRERRKLVTRRREIGLGVTSSRFRCYGGFIGETVTESSIFIRNISRFSILACYFDQSLFNGLCLSKRAT